MGTGLSRWATAFDDEPQAIRLSKTTMRARFVRSGFMLLLCGLGVPKKLLITVNQLESGVLILKRAANQEASPPGQP